jgi:hypothetical protein
VRSEGFQLERSIDDGTTWNACGGIYGVGQLAHDAANVRVYATERQRASPPRLGRSFDGGATWVYAVTRLPTTAELTIFVTDPVVSGALYISRFPDSTPGLTAPGLWVTTDGGDAWTGLDLGVLNQGVAAIAIDPTSTSTIHVGHAQRGGVFKTMRGGR